MTYEMLMWHMLFKVKEDSSHILNATIAKSLGMLQNIATRNFQLLQKGGAHH